MDSKSVVASGGRFDSYWCHFCLFLLTFQHPQVSVQDTALLGVLLTYETYYWMFSRPVKGMESRSTAHDTSIRRAVLITKSNLVCEGA